MALKKYLLSNPLFFKTLKSTQRLIWAYKSALYRRRREKIRRRIKAKSEPIEIVFFVTSMALWRYHGLFKILNDSPRYMPLIIPYFPPKTDIGIMRANRDAIADYASVNCFPFRDGYDFEKNTYDKLSDLHPDYVVYSQPYDWGYPAWGINAFSRNSLFLFTPYGAAVTKGRQFRDTPLTRVADRIFLGSPIERKVFLDELPVNQEALMVSGSELFEKIRDANQALSPWRATERKRVIWAPHHSIDSRHSFSSSYFEQLAEPMLEIVRKYAGTIDFAFKPHPILKSRLYEKWGKERTDRYYAQWDSMDNTFSAQGSYVELFAFSDAIIHDCASFAAEYLYTAKPAFYITESETPGEAIGNEFGQQCFMMHYHGHTPKEIENFLTDTVVNGKDPLKTARTFFRDLQLAPEDNIPAAQKMFDALIK